MRLATAPCVFDEWQIFAFKGQVYFSAAQALDAIGFSKGTLLRAAGGLHHIATVLSDLGTWIDAKILALLSDAFERSVGNGSGYYWAFLAICWSSNVAW